MCTCLLVTFLSTSVASDDQGEPLRTELHLSDLNSGSDIKAPLVSYSNFLPIGKIVEEPAPLEGHFMIPGIELTGQFAQRPLRQSFLNFPGVKMRGFVTGWQFHPMPSDQIIQTGNGRWNVILSTGRAWSEPGDQGWSRVAFPITVAREGGVGALNGVATLAYMGEKVSALRIQFAQESIPNSSRASFAGQVQPEFTAAPISDKSDFLAGRAQRLATDVEARPWSELEAKHGDLSDFTGAWISPHVTISGLLVGDVFYHSGCKTRYGAYPFCDQMRFGVYSVSKSLGAAIALLHLAERYGADVFEARVLDFVPLTPRHDGWTDVTFRDLLNMATGVGDMVPERVKHYVDADSGSLEFPIWSAPDIKPATEALSAYGNYPWGPGEVLRYKSSDTLLLSMAMDAYVRDMEGDTTGLWDVLQEGVYAPLGFEQVPTRMLGSVETGWRIPRFEAGMYPTYQEILKLSRLLRDGGRYAGRQILHEELTRRALSTAMDRGLPSGWRYEDGGEANYDLSFWLAPFEAAQGCETRTPLMSGYGGNYVLLMPNGMIGLRIADGPPEADATYDSAGMRRVADRISSFCD